MGYARRRLPHQRGQRAHRRRRRARRSMPRQHARAARPHRLLHRAERGGLLRSLAHDPRPGRRAGHPARHAAARRGRAEGDRAVPRTGAARSGDHRQPLPAPGLRRPAAAADGGDGADRRPRGRDPRRADHRARRDDADRGAARVPPRRARAPGHGGLREPRPGGRRADGRPHPGAARRQDARAECDRATAHGAAERLHEEPARRGAARGARHAQADADADAAAAGARPVGRLRPAPRGRPAGNDDPRGHRSAAQARPGDRRDRRIGLGQDDAGARHRRPARALRGQHGVQRPRAQADARAAQPRRAAPHPDRVPVGRHGAQSVAHHRAHPGAAAAVLQGPEGRGAAAAHRGAARPRAAAAHARADGCPAGSRAGRSSASTWRARSPPSRT